MLEDFFKKYVIRSEDSIVIACSGGADSMYLVSEVMRVHPRDRIAVAHFNHLLRGSESDADEAFVREYCATNVLVFESASADVSAEATRSKKGVEETARKLRYEFLESVRVKLGAKYILTAHHLDDSVETLILNLIRGAKLGGLTGIPEQNGHILRPLLDVTKSEILSRLQERQINYCTDSTNADTQYSRNRMRANILPEFEAINSEYRRTLTSFMSYASELQAEIDGRVGAFLSDDGSFRTSDFAELSLFFQRETVRAIYVRVRGDTVGLSEGNIAEMIRYILTAEGGTEKVVGDLRMEKRGGVVYVKSTMENECKLYLLKLS